MDSDVLKHLMAEPTEPSKVVFEAEPLHVKLRSMYGQFIQRASLPEADNNAHEAVNVALSMQHALDDLLIISTASNAAARAAAERERPMRGSGVPHPAWSTF
jgi:hypothetical protein